MMLPTHALWGMAIALPVAAASPELGGVALAAGFLGGILPDLDMYAGHRKTLHYPVYYSAIAAVAIPAALLVATPAAVAAACLLAGAALHSLADAAGGGLELRPWEATSDRAVFDHHRGEWIAPRRWVRYDGAPEDLLLAVAAAVPLLLVVGAPLRWVVGGAVAVGAVYALLRRTLADAAVALLALLPDRAVARLPPRYAAAVGDRPAGLAAERR